MAEAITSIGGGWRVFGSPTVAVAITRIDMRVCIYNMNYVICVQCVCVYIDVYCRYMHTYTCIFIYVRLALKPDNVPQNG